MNRKTTALASLAVLGAGALVLSGCASSSSSPTQATLPLTGWTAVDPSTLQQGGTLNLAVLESGTDAGNWNPFTAEGNEEDVIDILAPTAGGPYVAQADGTVKLDTDYAKSVTLSGTGTTADPQVVDVQLNPAAKFEDGSAITANDYKATYAALSGANSKYDIASSQGFDDISTFDVVSDTEFKVTFKDAYADWQGVVAQQPVPASIAGSPDAWNKDAVEKALPSVGPYAISKYDDTAKTYTETPNPQWWGAKPKLDKITFTVIDQTAQAQAFANGELNAIDNIQDSDTLQSALKKSGAAEEYSGGTTWAQVTFNGLDDITSDVAVRKAVAQAIDRDGMAKAANSPLGVPATSDGNWIFMPGQKGYQDTVGQLLPFDTTAAKKDLTDGGWTENGGVWTKDGKQLKLTIIYPQGTTSNQNRGLEIQASLKAIDIPVTVKAVPSADYFTDIIAGKYQVATFGWGGTLFPISAGKALFYPAQKAGDEAGSNFAFITDPAGKLGTLWDQSDKELDTSKRLDEANQLNQIIASYVPMIPIYPYPNVSVVDGNLANYGPSTFDVVDWTQVGYSNAAPSTTPAG